MIKTKETVKSFKEFSMINRENIIRDLNTPANILIVSHKNPDGDAVGSGLGLGLVLESLGHTVKVYLPDDAPDFLKWLPSYERVGIYERSPGKFHGLESNPDIIFFLDFNSLERLGEMAEAVKDLDGTRILIDHHPGGQSFYDYGIVNTQKGSTCELVFLFLEETGLLGNLNSKSATCLYSGIITDTLGLQVGSSYNEVYRVTGMLIDAGIDKDKVHAKIYSQYSASRMKLLGYCLAEKMKILPEYQAAYIWITKEELARFKHIKGDTEGFVNYPLSIKNVNFTVLFTELDGEVKLSLRSKGDIPVNEFAAEFFNGGGHRNASGGRSSLSMEETLIVFEDALKGFMTNFLSR